jgi:hypothetical protein
MRRDRLSRSAGEAIRLPRAGTGRAGYLAEPNMKAIFLSSAVALGLGLALPTPLLAAPAPEAGPPPAAPALTKPVTEATLHAKQVTLTPKLVEQFIASFPPLVELADQLDDSHPLPPTTDEEEEGPEYLLVDHLRNPQDLAQIREALAKYGFSTYAEWANVAHSVSIAADAAEPTAGPSDLADQKAQALAAIDKNESLTPAQKASRRQDVEDQFAALEEFIPLPGNVVVVKPYLDRIRALGADEGD